MNHAMFCLYWSLLHLKDWDSFLIKDNFCSDVIVAQGKV